MQSNHRRVLSTVRLGDISKLAFRLAGAPYLSTSDFRPEISAEDGERLSGLARRARGDGPAPILVLGVMPRSGTNAVRDAIALHPDVYADPGRLYEFPLLHAADAAAVFMDQFHSYFPRNAEVTHRHDALAMLAGAWLRELQLEAGDKRILLKSPHVQNLFLAPHIFPDAKIVLCLRDGRDVVDSSLRTFSRVSLARKTFAQLATEWKFAAEAIVGATQAIAMQDMVTLARFEDLQDAPSQTVTAVLNGIGLDVANYDMEAFANLPVRGSSRSTATDDSRWQPETRSAHFKPVNRWHAWSDKRKARFDRIAGQALEQAGYARHG